MCNPVLIMGGISALSSVASSVGANQQAQAQMDAAVASNEQQQAALQLQQVQINQAASQEAQDRAAQTNRELGKFMVAAGASGVSGVSLDRQDSAITTGEQLDLGVLATNRENKIEQSQLQALGVRAQAQGRVNQAESSGVGPLQGILGIASGAASGAAAGSQLSGIFGAGATAVPTKAFGPQPAPVPFMLSGGF